MIAALDAQIGRALRALEGHGSIYLASTPCGMPSTSTRPVRHDEQTGCAGDSRHRRYVLRGAWRSATCVLERPSRRTRLRVDAHLSRASGAPVVTTLRQARTSKGTEVRTVVKHVTRRLRRHWPKTLHRSSRSDHARAPLTRCTKSRRLMHEYCLWRVGGRAWACLLPNSSTRFTSPGWYWHRRYMRSTIFMPRLGGPRIIATEKLSRLHTH
jgi:hypothetical protein